MVLNKDNLFIRLRGKKKVINEYDYSLKYLFIGNKNSDKLNIIVKFIYGELINLLIVEDFYSKIIETENGNYKIHIFDTPSEDRENNFIKNTTCAILVYNITNRESFNYVIERIENYKIKYPKMLMVLAGNNSNLEEERKVTYEEGKFQAQKYDILFYEVSPETGLNIDNIFIDSVEQISINMKNEFYGLFNLYSYGIKTLIEEKMQELRINNEKLDKEDNIEQRRGKCGCFII